MESLLLIAETPNAGTLGYRFLVSSSGIFIGDAAAAAFVGNRRSHLQVVGVDYITVRHKVIQRHTGRSDADETLVLVGVDTSRLGPEEEAKLIRSLQALLPAIDTVARKIDWTTEKRLIVPQPALAEWISEDFRSLPRTAFLIGPRVWRTKSAPAP